MNHEHEDEDDDALEGLFQEAILYEPGGMVSTAHLCDVLYWAMRGVPYTSTQGANNIFLRERWEDDVERANQVARWRELSPSVEGGMRDMVFRLLCEGKNELASALHLRLPVEEIAQHRRAIFGLFGVANADELIAKAQEHGIPDIMYPRPTPQPPLE